MCTVNCVIFLEMERFLPGLPVYLCLSIVVGVDRLTPTNDALQCKDSQNVHT